MLDNKSPQQTNFKKQAREAREFVSLCLFAAAKYFETEKEFQKKKQEIDKESKVI